MIAGFRRTTFDAPAKIRCGNCRLTTLTCINATQLAYRPDEPYRNSRGTPNADPDRARGGAGPGLIAAHSTRDLCRAFCYSSLLAYNRCGIENSRPLQKRCINGTHVRFDPKFMMRSPDEEMFRYYNRTNNDAGRFLVVATSVLGKHLTHIELTSKI